MASPQLQKEIDLHNELLAENPPLESYDLEGCYFYWECPRCEKRHDSEDQAAECCMPDGQDMDDQKYHGRRG